MKTVDEVESAIRNLSSEERDELLRRLEDLLWGAWDRQIEADGKAGRLDRMLDEVDADIAAGRTRPLDELLDDV